MKQAKQTGQRAKTAKKEGRRPKVALSNLALSSSGRGSKKLMKIEKATSEKALLGQQGVLMFEEKEEWPSHCLLLLFALLRTRLEALWWREGLRTMRVRSVSLSCQPISAG
jgi:hypothetical protein